MISKNVLNIEYFTRINNIDNSIFKKKSNELAFTLKIYISFQRKKTHSIFKCQTKMCQAIPQFLTI